MKATGARIKRTAREKSPTQMDWFKKECGKTIFLWAIIRSKIKQMTKIIKFSSKMTKILKFNSKRTNKNN